MQNVVQNIVQNMVQNVNYSLEDLGFTIGEKGQIRSFNAEKFLEKFLLEHEMVRDEECNYYVFSSNYWKELSQIDTIIMLKNFMDSYKKYLWKSCYEKELFHFMKLNVKEIEKMNPYNYIMPFRDFDFDFRTGATLEKDPSKYFNYVKNFTEKEMKIETPVFDKFMKDIVQGDDEFKRYLLKLMGILLSGENRLNLVFMIFGTGANSKSLFSNLIEYLIGENFVSSRTVEAFTSEFGLEGLEDAKLVTCGESETNRAVNFSMIKSISGNDKVPINGKNKAIKSEKIRINFLFLTNKLYKISDKSDGIKRRMQVIEFKHQIAEEDRDPELFEKLKKEEKGILNKILNAYSEMISEDGRLDFNMPQNVSDFTDHYIENYLVSSSGNSLDEKKCVDFIKQYFEVGTSNDRLIKSKVYDLYCSQINDISSEAFWKIANEELKKMNVKTKRNGERFLEGIKIKDEYKNKITNTLTIGVRKTNQFQTNTDLLGVV